MKVGFTRPSGLPFWFPPPRKPSCYFPRSSSQAFQRGCSGSCALLCVESMPWPLWERWAAEKPQIRAQCEPLASVCNKECIGFTCLLVFDSFSHLTGPVAWGSNLPP